MESQKLYVDYTGGAGPELDQANNNDKALKLALEANGIKPIWNSDYMRELCGDEEDVLEIINPNGHKCWISYDRWGFCAETSNDFETDIDIDQAPIVDAVKFVKAWYHEN